MTIEADGHKLGYHPERFAEWKSKGDCFPIYVEMGLTNRCNHRCVFCALDWLEHGGADLDVDVACRNLEDMASHGVKSVMFAGEGEPLLHKDVARIVSVAKKSVIDVSITSNGALFNPEMAREILPNLSWIRFSLDAGTPETYALMHGTRKENFEKVIQNIKDAAEIKRRGGYDAEIGTQALLTKHSLQELEQLAKIVKAAGADNLQIKPYSHHPSSKNDLRFDYAEAEKIRPALDKIGGEDFQVVYRTNTINRLQSARAYSQCHGLPFFSLIDARGNVIPCNLFYGNPDFAYGNINEKLFSEVWGSERRKRVNEKLMQGGIEDCRKGCRLDPINGYLERLKNPHPHDSFI
ncbi:MAG: radical SAM protein [archaeon]